MLLELVDFLKLCTALLLTECTVLAQSGSAVHGMK